MVRDKGFATAVQSYCHSACALAWLGRIKRYMGAKAEIGFHRLPAPKTVRESRVGNDSNARTLPRWGCDLPPWSG